MDVDDLTPYDKNARKHTQKDLITIINSIQEFGMNDPIGIWGDKNIIVEGHGRLMACKELGITTVPCIRLDYLTDEQRRAYTLAHNKTAEMSSWDTSLLDEELDGIFEIDMSDFGFETSDFKFEDDDEYYGDERERTMDAYNLHNIDLDRCAGKWQMPILKATKHIPDDLISFNYVLSTQDYKKGVHFYIDDYQFERIWNRPDSYIEKIAPFDCMLTPDFSLYTEMPLAMQMWNVFRSRLIGQMYQDAGIIVIPTLQWCREDTFEFCFEGIEKGGVVSVSTIGVKREEEASKIWFAGMDEAIRQIEPSHVVVYGGDIGYKFPCGVSYIANHNSERFKGE